MTIPQPATTPAMVPAGPLGFWPIAASDPDRIAIVESDGAATTFGDLLALVNRLSHGLRARGVAAGDTVALAMPNCAGLVAMQLATAQIGGYLTPVNWHLTAAEIGYILGDCEARVFVAHPRFAETAGPAADLAGIPAEARFGVAPSAGEAPLAGFLPLDDLAAGQPDTPPADRVAGRTMLYTSGTTGRPKGVRKAATTEPPETDLTGRASLMLSVFDFEAGNGVHLVTGPLYHAAPNLYGVGALHLGHTLVLMDKWDAERTLELIERHRVTGSHLVPTMFHRLLGLPDEIRSRYDVSSLRQVLHGAAPCPISVKRRMIRWWGPVIYEYYGATEGLGTAVSSPDWLARPGTVGRPVPRGSVTIVDDDDLVAPAGVPGTVYLGALDDFKYFKSPEKTAASWRGTSFTVGDIGYLDDDGWLFLCDRRSDLIISGGVNIYPAEVEAALLEHPAVDDVAVIGVPDAEWGQRVVALVQPRPGVATGSSLAADLTAHSRGLLAGYKCPRVVEFRDLPRTATGKLSRSRIRADFLASREVDSAY